MICETSPTNKFKKTRPSSHSGSGRMKLAFRADLSPTISRPDTSALISNNPLHMHRKNPTVLRWDCITAPGLFRSDEPDLKSLQKGLFSCTKPALETEVLESKEREQCVPSIVMSDVNGPELPECLNSWCNGRHLITDCDIAARNKARFLFVRPFKNKIETENKNDIHDATEPQPSALQFSESESTMQRNGRFLKRPPHGVYGQCGMGSDVIVQKGRHAANSTNVLGLRDISADDEANFSGLEVIGKLKGNACDGKKCNHEIQCGEFVQRKAEFGGNVPHETEVGDTGRDTPSIREEIGPEFPACLNPLCTDKHLIRDCHITGPEEARKLIVEFFARESGPQKKRTRKRKNKRSKKQ